MSSVTAFTWHFSVSSALGFLIGRCSSLLFDNHDCSNCENCDNADAKANSTDNVKKGVGFFLFTSALWVAH